MRKTLLSESKHEERSSGINPPPSSYSLNVTTRVETEWDGSPRPWKKIRRTYSLRTNGQSFRDLAQEKDRASKGAKDTGIRLPLDLTAGQSTFYGEESTVQFGQQDLSSQRAPPREIYGTTKNVQTSYGSHMQSCPVSSGLSNRKLKEGICKALEALLRATDREETNGNSGCRSLFSTCLRQVPHYIAEEQRFTNAEDPKNDIDVASDVYVELEAFGSASNGGWESLREVVRSHGVSLIREAIQDGLIDVPFSRHLFHLCVGLAAYEEAECLIEGMITWVKYRLLPRKEFTGLCAGIADKGATSYQVHAIPLTDEAPRIVGALRYYVSQTGRHGFMYRQIAVMLEDGTLPVDWVSSKAMIECWNGVIRSITQQDGHARSAALLLQTAISNSHIRCDSTVKVNPQAHDLRLRAGKPTTVRPTLRSDKLGHTAEATIESQPTKLRDVGAAPRDKDYALQSTFCNILTVLSAVNILRLPELDLDSSHPNLLSVSLLRDMALEVRQALELANVSCYVSRNWSVPADLLLPLLSARFVSVLSRKAGTDISLDAALDLATLANLVSSNESVCNAGSFLCEVARCCGEAKSGDGFRFVKVMVKDLISIANSDYHDKATQRFCRAIAHAAAFAFSEDTGQPKHLDWALDIERTIGRSVDESPKVVVDKTPARQATRNKDGYRWEEGICEWIAKTPALGLQGPPASEYINTDTTYGQVSKLTLVQAMPPLSKTPSSEPNQQPYRPKNASVGRRASCEYPKIGVAKKSFGNAASSEKLLFVMVSPHPYQAPRPPVISKRDAATDLDELSTPESSQDQPVALREISNPPCGTKRSSGWKYDSKDYRLDILTAKRRRSDTEAFYGDMDDELG